MWTEKFWKKSNVKYSLNIWKSPLNNPLSVDNYLNVKCKNLSARIVNTDGKVHKLRDALENVVRET